MISINQAQNLAEKRALLREVLPSLRERYGVREMWLFGSYVRGEETAESDLDVLVTFDNAHLSLIDFIELELGLSEMLGIKIDLVEREGLKPLVGGRILKEMVPV